MKGLIKYVPLLMMGMLATSCERDSPLDLPDATTTGENTFGARINGDIWVADPIVPVDHLNGHFSQEALVLGGNDIYPADLLRVEAFGSVGSRLLDYDSFYLAIDSLISVGQQQFDSVTVDNSGHVVELVTLFEDGKTGKVFSTIGNLNTLNITRFDTIDSVISGTFEMNLVAEDGEVLKITDGRFDITYTPHLP